MAATIKDIAKKLNISTAAVSKAINNKDDVSEDLKKRVKDVAEELGYSPNYFAKKLVMNKSSLIAVFISGLEKLSTAEHFGFNFIEGIMEQSDKNDYDVIIFSEKTEKSYKKICEEKKIEGAIFIGLKSDDKYIKDIKNMTIPVSVIDLYIRGKNINYISSDNEAGVKKALEYIYNIGHRDIAIIAGEYNSQIGDIRYNKYLEFVKNNNIFNKNFITRGDFTRESGYNAMQSMLSLKKIPSAVFAISDLMAIGAIQAIQDKKMKVPEDISVIGFDNIKACEYINPKLTTISQNAIEIGRESANSIIARLENKKVNKKILIEPELVIRESCAENIKK